MGLDKLTPSPLLVPSAAAAWRLPPEATLPSPHYSPALGGRNEEKQETHAERGHPSGS